MVAAAIGNVLGGEADIDLVATAGDLAEALDVVGRLRPDVIVADQHLPDGQVTDHITDLLMAAPGAAVLVLAGLPTEQAFLTAMDAGAAGFVSKAQPMGEFLDAVRQVSAGATVVAPSLLPSLVRRINGGTDRSALTTRELQILQHLAAGRSTSRIATELALSPNTIRNHVSNLHFKLGAHSRLEAVSIGTRLGLVAPAPN